MGTTTPERADFKENEKMFGRKILAACVALVATTVLAIAPVRAETGKTVKFDDFYEEWKNAVSDFEATGGTISLEADMELKGGDGETALPMGILGDADVVMRKEGVSKVEGTVSTHAGQGTRDFPVEVYVDFEKGRATTYVKDFETGRWTKTEQKVDLDELDAKLSDEKSPERILFEKNATITDEGDFYEIGATIDLKGFGKSLGTPTEEKKTESKPETDESEKFEEKTGIDLSKVSLSVTAKIDKKTGIPTSIEAKLASDEPISFKSKGAEGFETSLNGFALELNLDGTTEVEEVEIPAEADGIVETETEADETESETESLEVETETEN